MKKIFYSLAILLLLLFNVSHANSAFVVTNVVNNIDEIKFQANVRSIDQSIKVTEYNNKDGTIYLVLTGYQNDFSPTLKDVITASDDHALVNQLSVQTTEERPNELSIKIIPKSPISYFVYHNNNQLFFDLRAKETQETFSINMNDERNKFLEHPSKSSTFSVILNATKNSDRVSIIAKNFPARESVMLMANWNKWDTYTHKNFILLSDAKITPSRSLKPITQGTDKITISFSNIGAHSLISIVADFAKIKITSYKNSNMTIYAKKEPWGDVLESIAILEGVSLISQSSGVYFGQ